MEQNYKMLDKHGHEIDVKESLLPTFQKSGAILLVPGPGSKKSAVNDDNKSLDNVSAVVQKLADSNDHKALEAMAKEKKVNLTGCKTKIEKAQKIYDEAIQPALAANDKGEKE